MGEVVKLPFQNKDIMKKLILYLALLLVAFARAEIDHSLQEATEPETLKNEIVDPKESLEKNEEDKLEAPELDENVVDDDLSDLDRWSRSCRDRRRFKRACARYANRGYCNSRNYRFRSWMNRNCKRTCGRCGGRTRK